MITYQNIRRGRVQAVFLGFSSFNQEFSQLGLVTGEKHTCQTFNWFDFKVLRLLTGETAD